MAKYPKGTTDFVEAIYSSCKTAGMNLEGFCILAEALMSKAQEIKKERKQKMLEEKL